MAIALAQIWCANAMANPLPGDDRLELHARVNNPTSETNRTVTVSWEAEITLPDQDAPDVSTTFEQAELYVGVDKSSETCPATPGEWTNTANNGTWLVGPDAKRSISLDSLGRTEAIGEQLFRPAWGTKNAGEWRACGYLTVVPDGQLFRRSIHPARAPFSLAGRPTPQPRSVIGNLKAGLVPLWRTSGNSGDVFCAVRPRPASRPTLVCWLPDTGAGGVVGYAARSARLLADVDESQLFDHSPRRGYGRVRIRTKQQWRCRRVSARSATRCSRRAGRVVFTCAIGSRVVRCTNRRGATLLLDRAEGEARVE